MKVMIVHRSYKYRIYPTVRQEQAMVWTLDRCRELYNAALEERVAAYRKCGVSLNYDTQSAQMPGVKTVRPEYAELDSQMVREPLQRLEKAFKAFFRRIRAGQAPGFPRFKGKDRYNSFTFQQWGWKLSGDRLTLRGIGSVKMRLHRLVEGAIKTVSIQRNEEKWYARFSCVLDMPDPMPDSALPVTGIDMGLEYFATMSDGSHIANPRHFREGQAILTRSSRALARKKRGSCRRNKAKLLVAKAHRKVRNQRRDFHHKTSLSLVGSHGMIVVEELQTANMVRRPKPVLGVTEEGQEVYLPNGATAKSGLNKSISDAGWGQFLSFLTYKAEEAGCRVVKVNPAGTSQACSGCGVLCPKGLEKRWHSCTHCGLSIQRDVNAARNILARAGQALQASA